MKYRKDTAEARLATLSERKLDCRCNANSFREQFKGTEKVWERERWREHCKF